MGVTAINAGLPQGAAVAPYEEGPVYTRDASATGATTALSATQPPAPSSGIPAP
jgi:hypothetical protein